MPAEGTPAGGSAGTPEEQARLARARSRSVYLATPIARHPVRQYTFSLAKTLVYLAQLGIPSWMQQIVGNSNVPRARNELAAGFLASEYDTLLFIDDDMGFAREDVLRLLASEHDVIGGVGVKKSIRPDTDPERWCMRRLNGELHQDEMGAIEVEAVGTGFLKITREPFERMRAEHPEWKRRGWPNMPAEVRACYYEFFRFGNEGEDEIGEDVGFCREWRRLGGSVWIDPTIKLDHVGEYVYNGNIEALLEALPTELVTPLRREESM